MTRYSADWFIAPCDPDKRNQLLDINAANGWRGRPGMMDWDHGWTFDPEQATAPLVKPTPIVIKPTRPSGWWPFLAVLATPIVAGIVMGVVVK